MKNYKGYYIDGVYFHSKEDIDNFRKEQAIEHFNMLNRMFSRKPSLELSVLCSEAADRLHNNFGFSYEELEEMELEAFA